MGREGCQEVQEREIQSPSAGEEQPVHQYSLETSSAAQENMGIQVENKLTRSQQCSPVTKNSTLGCIRKSVPSRSRGVILLPSILLFSSST